jgi:HK97 family phage prohead protease
MYNDMIDEEDNQMNDVDERGALPPSYRLATSDDIPVAGAMCSVCCHYENREEPYCHKWDATVAADYYCDAFMPLAMKAEVSEEEMPDEMNHWVVTEKEDRSIVYSNLEVRASADGKTLTGYAAVFDSPSEPLPWTEYVRRGAFTKTINDGADVRLLIDHEGIPLARTKSGTLTLEEDDYGLRIAAELDDANPDAARVISALRRGDLSQMSFAFQTVKDSWNSDRSTRELKEVRLHDVSVVTYPAYEETLAEVRTRNSTPSVILPTVLPITLRKRQIEIMRQQAVT